MSTRKYHWPFGPLGYVRSTSLSNLASPCHCRAGAVVVVVGAAVVVVVPAGAVVVVVGAAVVVVVGASVVEVARGHDRGGRREHDGPEAARRRRPGGRRSRPGWRPRPSPRTVRYRTATRLPPTTTATIRTYSTRVAPRSSQLRRLQLLPRCPHVDNLSRGDPPRALPARDDHRRSFSMENSTTDGGRAGENLPLTRILFDTRRRCLECSDLRRVLSRPTSPSRVSTAADGIA